MANPNWKLTFLRAILIACAGLWVYSPVIRGDWLWDDYDAVLDNPIVKSPTGLWTIWFEPSRLYAYYPITISVQWLQWHLWGMESSGYHLTNILLNILNGLLVWRLLDKFNLRWAWLGGLIFVVHPANVESVAWMAEIKNTLSTTPFLISMCAWIDYEERKQSRDYWLAWGLFLIAIACKTTVVMFPLVLLLYAWWKRGRIDLHDFVRCAPFLAISFAFSFATAWLQHHHTTLSGDIPLGGFFSRLACAGLALMFYFLKAILPMGLMPIYPQWKVDPPSLSSFAPWLIFIAALYMLWTRRDRWGRHALLGLGFFVLMLAPFLGFKAISYMGFTWVMDHFLYVPAIGVIGLIVALLELIDLRIPAMLRAVWIGALALVIGLLMLESQWYAGLFADAKALWTYALEKNELAWPAHDNLGNILFGENRDAEAIKHYRRSVQLNPHRFEAHNNLGFVLGVEGQTEEGIHELELSLEINPVFAPAHINMGDLLVKAGRIEEAKKQYEQALEIDPNNADVRTKLNGLSALQKPNP